MKIVEKIKLKIVIFTAVKNRCILHGRVFGMAKFFLSDLVMKIFLQPFQVTLLLNQRDI